jgi:hypothetical protein
MLWEKPSSTWVWSLTPREGGRQTRLVTRLRQCYDWRGSPANALLTLILFEWGDFPMMRKLLLGVKDRAEGTTGRTRRGSARVPSTTVENAIEIKAPPEDIFDPASEPATRSRRSQRR